LTAHRHNGELANKEPGSPSSVPAVASIAEQQVGAAFELAAIGMSLQAPDSRVLRVNRALCDMLGYSRRQLLALPPAEWLHPEDRPGDAMRRARLLAGETGEFQCEQRFLRRDCSILWGRLTCHLSRGQDGEPLHFLAQLQDLSAQKQAQAVLQAQEDRSRAARQRLRQQDELLDQSGDAIAVHLLDGTLRYWNMGAQRMLGFTREQALGRTFESLMGPGARLKAADQAKLLERGEWLGELQCVDAQGRVLVVERRCTVVPAADGSPAAILTVSTDVTERRRAEKEIVLLNNVLEQRIRKRTAELEESNEDLREFAYSLAHDLRAPLASIDGFSAQLHLRAAGQLDERCRHYLARVRAGVRTMSDLTEALLALADLSNTQLLHQQVDLSALARCIVERLRDSEPARDIAALIDTTTPTQGDVRLLTDVLENLLGNAWKFTSKKPHAQIAFGGESSPGGSYVYHVKDNGAGFDPAYAQKLFGPFQRLHTADEFQGTGIGLAMVRKIVSRHGGRVWAESVPGAGASFYFTLNESKPLVPSRSARS
jgi:PAS domain S-box-containing protein